MDRNEQMEINKNIRKRVGYISRQHTNCIKINIGDGSEKHKKHEIKKCIRAVNELFEGNTIYVECDHLDTKRISDIFIANFDKVVEIANTETE